MLMTILLLAGFWVQGDFTRIDRRVQLGLNLAVLILIIAGNRSTVGGLLLYAMGALAQGASYHLRAGGNDQNLLTSPRTWSIVGLALAAVYIAAAYLVGTGNPVPFLQLL